METSEQAATEPLPEENTLGEKPEETDGRPNQAEETGAKVEEEPKQTEQPVSEEAIIQDQVEIQSEQVEETDPQKPDTE